MFKTLIIDGDSLLYRCGYAAEKEPVENAVYNLKNSLRKISEACKCPITRIYVKSTSNFRDRIAVTKPYKGTRTTPPPKHYTAMRDYLSRMYPTDSRDGVEADDLCSWHLYSALKVYGPNAAVLAGIDKDLLNTPGWHYNYVKKEFQFVSTYEADRNFMRQLLSGDVSDNVPGLPLIKLSPESPPVLCGEVRARRFLDGYPDNRDAMKAVVEQYFYYGSKEYLLEQGQLLWMTREFTTSGDPVLWQIPKFCLLS